MKQDQKRVRGARVVVGWDRDHRGPLVFVEDEGRIGRKDLFGAIAAAGEGQGKGQKKDRSKIFHGGDLRALAAIGKGPRL